MTTTTTQTTCPYCGVGCGLVVQRQADGAIAISGDSDHPANRGRLCSKGAALGETLGLEGRLLHPERAGRRISWDEALDRVAARFSQVIREHGPEAVAFYVSGQLLTEDYYVANKLMKGFLGSANIDTNSRLCMSSSVAGHKRAFGADAVPCCYEDLAQADLITLVGSNTAWCHPVLFQRIRAAKEARPELRIVVVDPRRTATGDIADLHLPLKPGSDIALFNGLLAHLARHDRLDRGFIARHTQGFEAALAAADAGSDPIAAAPQGGGSAARGREPIAAAPQGGGSAARGREPIAATAAACELAPGEVAAFFECFAATERCVTVYSQGVNQWSCGTDKVNAILNCHLATGRIGKPGAGPFSFTGQPNAMGGREVGGLANQLAAHRDFTPEDRTTVCRFWGATRMANGPGLKAVDLFQAVGDGRIKALWIMATNPAVSLPDADRVREAIQRCDFVVVSDCVRNTDTTRAAHLLLPATTWGEKSGTVTNSERRISRQRPFLDPPGEARPDWWILTQVARRMGFAEAFPYEQPGEIFAEHAALSALANDGRRAFDLGPLAALSPAEYDHLAPIQWPIRADGTGTARLFADGRFCHPDQRARFVAVNQPPPARPTDAAFPLVLNSGRIRDQWHTMTRSGQAPRLLAHVAEPFVQLHPADAAAQEIVEGGLAQVTTRHGHLLGRARISPEQRPGSLFVPMHWSDAFARSARLGALVNPACDPISGQPEFKHTPARVESYRPHWHAFLLSRSEIELPAADYATRIPGKGYWRYELAGDAPFSGTEQARAWLGAEGEWIEYQDPARTIYRGARLVAGRLEGCFFLAPSHELPERDWLAGLFAGVVSAEERASVLSGRPAPGKRSAGEIVCACHGVGRQTLLDAIRNDGLHSLATIGEALKAGTHCGSCIPELRQMLARERDAGGRAG